MVAIFKRLSYFRLLTNLIVVLQPRTCVQHFISHYHENSHYRGHTHTNENYCPVIPKQNNIARFARSPNKAKAIFAHQEFSFCESLSFETVLKPSIAFQTDTLRQQQRNHFQAGAPVQYPDDFVPVNRPLMFIKGIEIPLNRCKAIHQSSWNISKLLGPLLKVR